MIGVIIKNCSKKSKRTVLMAIYLIRHGETDWNRQGRLQGLEDIELNETGIRQAYECAGAFPGIPVDRILTSPLKRARQMADIIADFLGLPSAIVVEDLTERDFGRLSGLTPEERESFLASGEDPQLEPKEPLTRRLMSVLNGCADRSVQKSIVIVSHGAAINMILSYLSDEEIGTGKTILKNGCISRISSIERAFKIDFYNLTAEEFLNKKTTGL
jgi:uncharacterized phosphatase